LLLLAYAFAVLGIGINIWNASGGALPDMALPAAMGVLAEGVMFFLPAQAMTLSLGRKALAWALRSRRRCAIGRWRWPGCAGGVRAGC
jgi:hypothetical protein